MVADDPASPLRGNTLPRVCFQAGFWVPLAVCTWLALVPYPPDNPIFWLGDVVLHFAAFAYLSLALVLARFHRSRVPDYLKTAVFMIGYGVLLEVVQAFIPERSAELKDLLVDALGIGAGLVLARWLARPIHDLALSLSARF